MYLLQESGLIFGCCIGWGTKPEVVEVYSNLPDLVEKYLRLLSGCNLFRSDAKHGPSSRDFAACFMLLFCTIISPAAANVGLELWGSD